MISSETSWKSNEYRTRSSSEEDEVVPKGRSNRETSWRSTSPKTPPPTITTPPIVVIEESVEEMGRPIFVEHRPPTKKVIPKEKKAMVAPVTTEKSWMKILKLSKEEQDEMERYRREKNASLFIHTNFMLIQ